MIFVFSFIKTLGKWESTFCYPSFFTQDLLNIISASHPLPRHIQPSCQSCNNQPSAKPSNTLEISNPWLFASFFHAGHPPVVIFLFGNGQEKRKKEGKPTKSDPRRWDHRIDWVMMCFWPTLWLSQTSVWLVGWWCNGLGFFKMFGAASLWFFLLYT